MQEGGQPLLPHRVRFYTIPTHSPKSGVQSHHLLPLASQFAGAAPLETKPMNPEKTIAFWKALNSASGEINHAAVLSTEIFPAQDYEIVRRELAHLLKIIDSQILPRLPVSRI